MPGLAFLHCNVLVPHSHLISFKEVLLHYLRLVDVRDVAPELFAIHVSVAAWVSAGSRERESIAGTRM